MRVSEHYLGSRGAAYAAGKQSILDVPGYRLDYRFFRPFLGPHDYALDFGCGNGGMLELIRADVALAEGLEVNPTTAKIATERGLTIYQDIEDLPDRRYDVVISNHVLEHVRDPSSTLERLKRAMKAGGRIILKLPLSDWRDRKERVWRPGDIDHHLHSWTPMLIGNTLDEAGYRVDQIRIVTEAWHRSLMPLARLGLARPAFWAFSVVARRRQLFVVGRVPQ